GKASVPTPDSALARVAVSKRLTAIANQCKASVILIPGCQDNQTSMDGDHNGAFTEQLLRVWNRGAFKGDYSRFHAAIKARMPRTQVPNLFTLGPVGKTPASQRAEQRKSRLKRAAFSSDCRAFSKIFGFGNRI